MGRQIGGKKEQKRPLCAQRGLKAGKFRSTRNAVFEEHVTLAKKGKYEKRSWGSKLWRGVG